MDILGLIKTIQEDWAALSFFFVMGGFWWQAKAWFNKTNKALEVAGDEHTKQMAKLDALSRSIEDLGNQVDSLGKRIDTLDKTVNTMHDELHDHEIKLAVLETSTGRRAGHNGL